MSKLPATSAQPPSPCLAHASKAAVNSSGKGASAANVAVRPRNSYSNRVASECRKSRLVPAARAGDFHALGPIVHRFNVLAGKAFAPVQGGVFASPGIAAAVGRARSLGFLGAGQSSWGPAVFVLCADEDQASWLAGQFSESGHHGLWVARPANGGATLHEEPLN